MKISDLRGSLGVRLGILIVVYTVGLLLSLLMAYLLRFDFYVPPAEWQRFFAICAWLIPVKLLLLFAFRQFVGLLGYFSVPDLLRLFYASASSLAILILLWIYSGGALAPPRGVMLTDFVLSFMG